MCFKAKSERINLILLEINNEKLKMVKQTYFNLPEKDLIYFTSYGFVETYKYNKSLKGVGFALFRVSAKVKLTDFDALKSEKIISELNVFILDKYHTKKQDVVAATFHPNGTLGELLYVEDTALANFVTNVYTKYDTDNYMDLIKTCEANILNKNIAN